MNIEHISHIKNGLQISEETEIWNFIFIQNNGFSLHNLYLGIILMICIEETFYNDIEDISWNIFI